mmetsp:Transcript_55104/g.135152  ORF Transcript_55104/g.135152 Transcript_55104/m.135152 type:complete len:230 (-) Transcript_55104:49-738(-)
MTKTVKTIIAGGVAGSLSLLFVYPMDTIRTVLAVDVAERYSGIFDVLLQSWKVDYCASLYTGFALSSAGIFIYRGLYFGLYELVVARLPRNTSVMYRFAAGYTVTVLAGYLSYPVDTVRREMMAAAISGFPYSSTWHCASQLATNGGISAFFVGVNSNVIRGLFGAFVLASFDSFKSWYIRQRHPQQQQQQQQQPQRRRWLSPGVVLAAAVLAPLVLEYSSYYRVSHSR